MIKKLRVALAQVNPTVGDISGNCELITSYTQRAKDSGADIVAFPEMVITGYPPDDLLLKPTFLEDNIVALQQVAAATRGITAVVGFVDVNEDIYNSAAVIQDGQVVGVYHKVFLPNYSVFDEDRYFRRGHECPVFEMEGAGIGVNICEDIWYPTGPTSVQAHGGAEVIINISASPYRQHTPEFRDRMLATRAQDHTVYVCFVNLVGGQDELVFDGDSCIYDTQGRLVARGPSFRESLILSDLDLSSVFRRRLHDPRGRKLTYGFENGSSLATYQLNRPEHEGEKPPIDTPMTAQLPTDAELYECLKLSISDYFRKTGFFSKAVIALSGGIDSSLTAAITVDALGKENVIGVSMPSRYSSEGSRTDAEELAENLGIEMYTIPIEKPFSAFLDVLSEPFAEIAPDITEENLQARCRGMILMALSNKFGWLVVTTGNKSESAVGYSTLYGDTAGGFSLLKDVPKVDVYQLSRYRNSIGHVIPQNAIDKAPSAELRPDQTDQETLPPYDLLDPILRLYIEEDRSAEEIAALGFDYDIVSRVVGMIDHAEYKRRQTPPGPKVTPRAFGRDRRLPIINAYKRV